MGPRTRLPPGGKGPCCPRRPLWGQICSEAQCGGSTCVPPKGRVDALTPAARERHLIPNRSLQRHQVKRRPETWRPMSSPRDRHTQENGRGTTHGNHGHAATCQGAPRAEGGRRGPLQPWGGGTGFCWAEPPFQVICYGSRGH